MCSSTNVAQKHESTTWAASVPLDDLAHAIKAAVGVQPVRQLAAPALLKSVEQQQPQQQSQQQCSTSPGSPAKHESAKQPVRDAAHIHAPLPVRRPTLAEVRAASPVDSTASDLCRTDSSTSSRSSSVSDVDACLQLLLALKQQWPQLAEPASPAYFDNMDDMQQQLQDCSPSPHSSSSSSRHLNDYVHSSCAYLELSCNGHGAWDGASNEQHQQQKELLCKIWSELQIPVQHEEQDYFQQQQQLSPDSVLLLDTAGRITSSSCCTSGAHFTSLAAAQGQYAGKASSSSQRTSLESSCCSSRAISPDSAASEESHDAVSCCSTRGSRSSSVERKQRRVSWGPVTEYQLPPAATQTSIDCLRAWVQDGMAGVSSSGQDMQALASAAALVVCLAGTAAYMYARRAST